MKIKIICISKNKFDYISQAEVDYLKRLRRYTDFEIINLKEEPIKSRSKDEIIKIEGERLLAKYNSSFYNIALDLKGKELSSEELSNLIRQIRDFKGGKICFIIGGPLGLAETILKKVDLVLSFSRLTFTHQINRLLLLEQIYRSFEIINNTGYHK